MSACEWIILIAFEIFSLPPLIFFFHQRLHLELKSWCLLNWAFEDLKLTHFSICRTSQQKSISHRAPTSSAQLRRNFHFAGKARKRTKKKESSLKTSWWEFPPMELGVCNKNHLFIWWMYLDHGNMRSIFYVFLPFNLSSVDKVDVDGSRRELYPHRCTLNPLRRRLWRSSASETFGNKTELLLFFFLCVYASNNDGWDCLGGDRRKRAREKYHL